MVSDTHGRVHPEMIHLLQGVEGIVHAGDVGSRDVLTALEVVAPVTAVRGNMDHGAGWAGLPERALLEWRGLRILVVHRLPFPHDRHGSGLCLPDPRPDVVVFGHTHRAEVTWREGCLYFNPGSAGPRRFGFPCTMGLLFIDGSGRPYPRVVVLEG